MKMEVQKAVSSVNYHQRKTTKNPYYELASTLDDTEPVILHPLLIGKDLVVCMPEVNRVLRNVYQVLSQANYYLSKHGITSRRYTGAQLIRIKMLGILGHEAKVCSYILQRDAERVFDNFDMTGDSRKSTRIKWMDPVLLDEKPISDVPKRKKSPSPITPPPQGPVNVHLFELDSQIIVCAPEVQKVVQANFHQGATVGYYFTKLGIVPFKFIHTFHLDKVKELGIIKRSAVHCTYITKEDALRVFDAYGLGGGHLDEKVKFLDVIVLSDPVGSDNTIKSWKSGQNNIKKEPSLSMVASPKNDPLSPVSVGLSDRSSHSSLHHSDDEEVANTETDDMMVHVFIVEREQVVCMPDIHKIVQNIHGNSIQVNYYFNKLKVAKKRFCFAHLRELKARNVLQSNATYCTYVPRADAEKIFQIYCLVDDPKLKQIQWSDPINLDYKPNSDYMQNDTEDKDTERTPGEEVIVHTFLLDKTIVITVPDVHRIVDYLDEQSASLDYHFRKLGIAKCRFTYSQLHQLRRLNVIKRPTVCTYITRKDVDRLLNMYETDRNKSKINSVTFLPPVTLVPGTAQPFKSKQEKQRAEELNNQEKRKSFRVPTSPNENLTPTFIGKSNDDNDVIPRRNSEVTGGRESSDETNSVAINHLQNMHPSIDCPIVIPNGDYDPMKFSDERRKRQHSEDGSVFTKHPKYDADVTQLMTDINRKEDELRLLNDAYRREISQERERRIATEVRLEEMLERHRLEMKDIKDTLRTNEQKITQLRNELDTERELRKQFERNNIPLERQRRK